MNPEDIGRRKVLKGALGTSVLAAGVVTAPNLLFPALAQGERLVPFIDEQSEAFTWNPIQPNSTHWQDTRQISNRFTDNDEFYLVQHYGQPEVNNDSWRLKVTGMVDNELEISLSELMKKYIFEQQVGFECGGNGQRLLHGLIGNANWRGTSLANILIEAGIQDGAKEVVFFGADTAIEEIRGREVEKAFARSLSIEDAMRPNVKWRTQIHIQDTRYMGRFMGRDYVTLKRTDVGGTERWVENSVTTMNLKSSIVRVMESSGQYRVQGFVLNDGTPLENVEVKIDDGPWESANMSSRNTKYSWKLFSYNWQDPSPGEHTLISRATDINGNVQATSDELPEKVSFWEDFAQFPRRVRI